MSYAAQVRTSDNIVIGLWRGAGTIPEAPASADYYYFSLTQTEYDSVLAAGLNYGEDFRWGIVSGTLTELVDTRTKIAFFEHGTTTVQGLVFKLVGSADQIVDVKAMTNETTVDTTFNDNLRVQVSDGRWVRLTFTNGVAELTIQATTSREYSIVDQGKVNVLKPLRVRIANNSVL